MVFLDTLGSMASIMLIALVGCVLTRRDWITAGIERFLLTLLVNVILPPFLAFQICVRFTREDLPTLLTGTAIPAAAILITFAACLLAARAIGLVGQHRRLVALSCSLSNTGYIGIPVNIALFGEQGLPFLMLYFIANTVIEWTVGALALAGGEGGARLPIGQVVRKVLSPPLIGILAGLAVAALGIPVPRLILTTCGYIGGMCTPLAMLYIGALLARIDWKGTRPGRDTALGMAGRSIFCPIVTLVLVSLTDLPLMMKQVFVIQAAMPVLTNITVVAAYFGADRHWASLFVAISTIAGVITIPIWMTLLDILL